MLESDEYDNQGPHNGVEPGHISIPIANILVVFLLVSLLGLYQMNGSGVRVQLP